MNKRVALTLYLALWAALSAGVISGMTWAGCPFWIALPSAYLIFMLLNGSLAYRFRARQLKREGKEAPSYLRYLFLGRRIFRLTDDAPLSTHRFVGAAAALAGAFFVFCGVALALHGEWSLVSHPFIAASICLILAGIGAAFLYFAWRLFTYRKPPDDAA